MSHVCLAPPFEPASSGNIFAHATFERLHPALGFEGSADEGLQQILDMARSCGLGLMLDVAPASLAADGPISQQHRDWFVSPRHDPGADPRRLRRALDTQTPFFEQTAIADDVVLWWTDQLARLSSLGFAGFRCLNIDGAPAAFWGRLTHAVPDTMFLAWTPGVSRSYLQQLESSGFSLTCSSTGWWDGKAEWLFEELEILQRVAPALAGCEPSFLQRLASRIPHDVSLEAVYRQSIRIAATMGAGVYLPMGFEYGAQRALDPMRASRADMEAIRAEALFDLTQTIAEELQTAKALPPPLALRPVFAGGGTVTGLLRADAPDVRDASQAALLLINSDIRDVAASPIQAAPLPTSAGEAWVATESGAAALAPAEVRVIPCRRSEPVTIKPPALRREWTELTRVAIESVQPSVTGGDYPAKTIVGRPVVVSADIFGDGHEIFAGRVLWRSADETTWRRTSLVKIVNDRWEAEIRPERIGVYEFQIEAWWDRWSTYRHDLEVKVAAGQMVALEVQEGQQLLEEALARSTDDIRSALYDALHLPADPAALLSPEVDVAMRAADPQLFLARSDVHRLRVDRPAAEFAAWYELFPRSATNDPQVHGTFRSIIKRLPDIRAMGFDVLYFTPIHPIGTINRKGRNNSLRAESGDVGSPYAIGSADGGHDAVHPQLGTLEDLRLLQREAHAHGLELALDFAVQCAPDHPWVQAHREWFRWRPDGSMRYAENPPKKYEDIVNPDFYQDTSFPDVWFALRDAMRFWVENGIRIFRVDNPHTKPLPFWQWAIADLQSTHPDVLFLAEAFTRPKLMYRLAKAGFTQSYTYFTWRNTKQEITEYLEEISAPPVAHFFRPSFFVNTPDINPYYLQTSGRPGFLIRAALAATLSGLWGIYSGFELCEHAPLPGREEYLDSEKYEIRVRDYHAPGNIRAEIAALNRIRRFNPALQTHLGARFYSAANDQVLLYGKKNADAGTMVLVAVSLDPHTVQEADIEIPLWEFELDDQAAIAVTDLMSSDNFVLHGKNQRIRLDPSALPFHIWRLSRIGAS